MKFARRKRRLPQVIIVSLIDIFAILLIFVIVTATFDKKKPQPTVSIKLPESKSAVVAEKSDDPVILSISSEEKIFLDNNPVALAGLKEALAPFLQKTPPPPLALKADEKVSYGFLVSVLDALRDAGVKGNMSAFTDPK